MKFEKYHWFLGILIPFLTWLYMIQFFPNVNGRLGHDYSNFINILLEGRIWYLNNGFTIEWFTPAFGGGLPKFPDPQGMQYSLPQLLSLVFHPLAALKISFLLLLGIGYFGMYKLSTRFYSSPACNHLSSTLFITGTFFIFRMVVGHLTYHVYMLMPLMLFLSIEAAKSNKLNLSSFSALLWAYLFYAGSGNFVPVFFLANILVLSFYLFINENEKIKILLPHFLGPVILGTTMALPQISATLAFLKNYPRTNISPPQFYSFLDFLYGFPHLLFIGPLGDYKSTPESISSPSFLFQPHEMEYSLGIVTALLLTVALIIFIFSYSYKKHLLNFFNPKRIILAITILLVIICLSLTLIQIPSILIVLKKLPILKSLSSFFRMIPILHPLLCLAAASSLYLLRNQLKHQFTYALILIVISFMFLHLKDVSIYEAEDYDYSALEIGWERLNTNVWNPKIDGITSFWGNEHYIFNKSSKSPYQPIFGYALESYPGHKLIQGSPYIERYNVKDSSTKYFNFLNPICMVFPKENNCKPGDLFLKADSNKLTKFLQYQPIDFQRSKLQIISGYISKISFFVSLVIIIFPILRTFVIKIGTLKSW